MEQLSLPYRIALGAIVVFAALYFLVLKKDDSGSPAPAPVASVAAPATTTSGPTAPGVKGLSTAVEKAKGAAATQTKSDGAVQAATGGAATTGTTATTSPAAPATASTPATAAGITTTGTTAAKPAKAKTGKDPSKPILAELKKGHTAIVLFAGSSASDDQAVRAAVRRANTRGGKVDVHVVPIAKVGAYEAITRGVTVLQSPTTLVIGPQKTARTIVGFTTTAEVDQLASDVGGFNLAATSRTPAEKRYDKAITKYCGTGISDAKATAGSVAAAESFIGDVDRLAARISSLTPPSSRKGFQKRFVADLKALAGDLSATLATRKSGDQAGIDAASAKAVASLQLVVDEADNGGYTVCG